MSLSIDANERLYDALAGALDRVGPANEALYLTKLALLLANRVGDEAAVNEALQAAAAFSPTLGPQPVSFSK